MIYEVSKRMEISAAHKLELDYDSPCQDLHGHNWIITVHIRSTEKNKNGMVVDFKRIKELVHDRLDHNYINNVIKCNPTAENIGEWAMNIVQEYIEVEERTSARCYKVVVQESEGNIAEVHFAQ